MLATLPEAVNELYGKQIASARAGARRNDSAGISPDEVAKVIVDALTSPRPPTRRLVGKDAHIISLVARLPVPLRDRFVLGRQR
jgi:hypothetical protein